MSDATQKGGSMQAAYHMILKKQQGFTRMDKQVIQDQAKANALLKGNGRNNPGASSLGKSEKTTNSPKPQLNKRPKV